MFRYGVFLIPIAVIPFYIFSDSYIPAFIVLSTFFLYIYHHHSLPLKSLTIMGCELRKYFLYYNLAWVFWFNFWFVVALVVKYFSNAEVYYIDFIDYNINLFFCFLLGNLFSFSKLFMIKNEVLKFILISIIFAVSILIINFL